MWETESGRPMNDSGLTEPHTPQKTEKKSEPGTSEFLSTKDVVLHESGILLDLLPSFFLLVLGLKIKRTVLVSNPRYFTMPCDWTDGKGSSHSPALKRFDFPRIFSELLFEKTPLPGRFRWDERSSSRLRVRPQTTE